MPHRRQGIIEPSGIERFMTRDRTEPALWARDAENPEGVLAEASTLSGLFRSKRSLRTAPVPDLEPKLGVKAGPATAPYLSADATLPKELGR
jgi:hypothetical protein